MDELKQQAMRVYDTLSSLGFNVSTYDSLPMSLAFALADTRSAMQTVEHMRTYHLGFVGLRTLEMLYGAFRLDWDTGRTLGRKPPLQPVPLYAMDLQLLVVSANFAAALESQRELAPKDVMISLEIAMLSVHRAMDLARLDFQTEVARALDRIVQRGPREDGMTRWF